MDFRSIIEYLKSETSWTVADKLAIWIAVASLTILTIN